MLPLAHRLLSQAHKASMENRCFYIQLKIINTVQSAICIYKLPKAFKKYYTIKPHNLFHIIIRLKLLNTSYPYSHIYFSTWNKQILSFYKAVNCSIYYPFCFVSLHQ